LFDRARAVDEFEGRAARAVAQTVDRAQQRFEAVVGRLASLSPVGVLARGYSVTTTADGRVVRDAAELVPGEAIETRFARGRSISRVEGIRG
jgi:exodeoxyribonuclease VII large subunit